MHLSNHLFFFLQITLQQAYCLSFSLALSYHISKSLSIPYIFHYSPSLYDSLYLKLSVYRFLYMNLSLFTILRSNPYNHSPIIVYQPSSIPSSSLPLFHMYNTFILITLLSPTLKRKKVKGESAGLVPPAPQHHLSTMAPFQHHLSTLSVPSGAEIAPI